MIRFPHHRFTDDEPPGTVEFIDAASAPAVEHPAPESLTQEAEWIRKAGVSTIVLVHGTFAGNDVVGLTREIARVAPGFGSHLSELGKSWFDDLVGEVGNYTESYADCCSGLVNRPHEYPIRVLRFHWSGENHHLGRAAGMISLLDTLLAEADKGGPTNRYLVLAHSHGGNVMSMMSNFLGADRRTRKRFFDATRLHFRNPITGNIDMPQWPRVATRLLQSDWLDLPKLDIATFGTPLRYRWDTNVCTNLLHFVQHRPMNADQPQRAVVPTSVHDVLTAEAGDYVQHLGICGTDFLTSTWRDWMVDRRLRRMFEPNVRRRDVLKNLKRGRRASCDGTTLLVDYPDSDAEWNRKLFGHGVYTCREWLPFHLREIADRFYGGASERRA